MSERGAAGFPPTARLARAEQFRRAFRHGTRLKDRNFTLIAHPNGTPEARLGLAISRKHAGNAVVRNRLKRVVRESFRQRRTLLAGLDIVFVARPGLGKLSNERLFAALDRNWQRLIEKCA